MFLSSTSSKCHPSNYFVFYSLIRISDLHFSHKVPFTDDDDALLMKFIATYNPQPRGRLGTKLYERLVANVCIIPSPCHGV